MRARRVTPFVLNFLSFCVNAYNAREYPWLVVVCFAMALVAAAGAALVWRD